MLLLDYLIGERFSDVDGCWDFPDYLFLDVDRDFSDYLLLDECLHLSDNLHLHLYGHLSLYESHLFNVHWHLHNNFNDLLDIDRNFLHDLFLYVHGSLIFGNLVLCFHALSFVFSTRNELDLFSFLGSRDFNYLLIIYWNLFEDLFLHVDSHFSHFLLLLSRHPYFFYYVNFCWDLYQIRCHWILHVSRNVVNLSCLSYPIFKVYFRGQLD